MFVQSWFYSTINSTCRNQRNAIPVSQTLCKEVGTPIKMDANMKRKMSTVNKTNNFGGFKFSESTYTDVCFICYCVQQTYFAPLLCISWFLLPIYLTFSRCKSTMSYSLLSYKLWANQRYSYYFVIIYYENKVFSIQFNSNYQGLDSWVKYQP